MSSNYPQHNDRGIPLIPVDCDTTVVLTKNITIHTDQYERDENGCDLTCDLIDEIRRQHHSVTELLDELAKYINGELQGQLSWSRREQLNEMLDDCQHWQEIDITVEDYDY